jgi:hypothetical protein
MMNQKAENTPMKKRYTLYRFPSLGGSPKEFRFKITAWFCCLFSPGVVGELEDNKTDEYYAYWF